MLRGPHRNHVANVVGQTTVGEADVWAALKDRDVDCTARQLAQQDYVHCCDCDAATVARMCVGTVARMCVSAVHRTVRSVSASW